MLVELLAVAVVLAVLDGVWLSLASKRFYRRHLGPIMRERPDVVAAGLFYALYLLGVVVLAVAPADTVASALARGALLGAVAYGTYDLTNRATIQPFPWVVVVVDMVWGSFLTATAAAVAQAVS